MYQKYIYDKVQLLIICIREIKKPCKVNMRKKLVIKHFQESGIKDENQKHFPLCEHSTAA